MEGIRIVGPIGLTQQIRHDIECRDKVDALRTRAIVALFRVDHQLRKTRRCVSDDFLRLEYCDSQARIVGRSSGQARLHPQHGRLEIEYLGSGRVLGVS